VNYAALMVVLGLVVLAAIFWFALAARMVADDEVAKADAELKRREARLKQEEAKRGGGLMARMQQGDGQ
jgi:hypothetical protein